jgi:hypothetical protein
MVLAELTKDVWSNIVSYHATAESLPQLTGSVRFHVASMLDGRIRAASMGELPASIR